VYVSTDSAKILASQLMFKERTFHRLVLHCAVFWQINCTYIMPRCSQLTWLAMLLRIEASRTLIVLVLFNKCKHFDVS